MKNLKPSQLPEGTVIDDLNVSMFVKLANGIWDDRFGTCGCCCSGLVFDAGIDKKYHDMNKVATSKTSDEYFTDYTIMSVPPGFLVDDIVLHGEWDKDSSTFADGTGAHVCTGFNCKEDEDIRDEES